MQDVQEYLDELDSYKHKIGEAIRAFELSELDEKHGETMQNIKPIRFNYFLRYIYEAVFKPDDILIYNKQSNIDYKNYNLIMGILDIYILLCDKYNKIPSIVGFSKFTGITTETMQEWRRSGSPNSAIIKKISEFQENNLFDAASGGNVMALALGKVKHGWVEGSATIRIEDGRHISAGTLMDKYKSEAGKELPQFTNN